MSDASRLGAIRYRAPVMPSGAGEDVCGGLENRSFRSSDHDIRDAGRGSGSPEDVESGRSGEFPGGCAALQSRRSAKSRGSRALTVAFSRLRKCRRRRSGRADTVRHFFPWVRQGAAAGITTPDSLGSEQPADVSLQVSLQLANFTVPARDIKLYGPADVTAIDPRQIVRVQPQHLTTNFESNFFPLIEFDRPDFPWLFTPAKPGLNERLRPWICLVVVRKQEGVTLGRLETSPLAMLEFTSPVAEELPDLDESWAWVHAQVVGSATDTVLDAQGHHRKCSGAHGVAVARVRAGSTRMWPISPVSFPRSKSGARRRSDCR